MINTNYDGWIVMTIEHLFRVRFISYINIYSAVAPGWQDTQYFSESNLQQDSCRGICSKTIFRQQVGQPYFNSIFSDFQLLYLQKLHRIIALFLM